MVGEVGGGGKDGIVLFLNGSDSFLCECELF